MIEQANNEAGGVNERTDGKQPDLEERDVAQPVEEGSAAASAEPDGEPSPAVTEESPASTNGHGSEAPSPAPVAAAESTGSDAAAPAGDEAPKKVEAAAASKPSKGRVSAVYRALRSRRAIDGRIERVIKGGYEVRVGAARGFCPHSQIDLHRVDEPETYVGRTLPFRVTQVRRGGEDVVVSRRALLEEQRVEEAKAVRATLIEGAVMQGRVEGIADFGAFVDLGAGVMGLVHVSELSHNRVRRVEDVLESGAMVNVKVLKIDDAANRISLSIRQAEADPWQTVAETYRVGELYPGTVQRMTRFGVFVELAPGIEALAPASELPPRRGGWSGTLKSGDALEWMVLSVDAAQHRISVTPPPDEGLPREVPKLEVGGEFRGWVQRTEAYGRFVWLGPGTNGLMPNVWSGEGGARLEIGDEVEVRVVELSDDGRRIRLARKGVDTEQAPPPPRRAKPAPRRDDSRRRPAPAAQPADDGAPFGTTLAEKLRAALDRGEGRS